MTRSDKPQEGFISEETKSSSSDLPEIEKSATLDTVHNDEAIKVLANYTGDEVWTNEEEKKVLRRIDWKLMPILCVTYGLQYYDKAMFSQAVTKSFTTLITSPLVLTLHFRHYLVSEKTCNWKLEIATPSPLPFYTWALWLGHILP